MANKIKVADKFDGVVALLMGEPTEFSVEQAVEFIKERKAQHEKKNAGGGERKPTKTQVENAAKAEQMVAEMQENRLYTVTDISKEIKAVAGFSTQRITPLLTAMIKADKVEKSVEKGRSYYKAIR